MCNEPTIARILASARERGDRALLEPEGFEVLSALGFTVPAAVFVHSAEEALSVDLSTIPSNRVVVKVVSPDIMHKSDVGGIAIVANEHDAVVSAIRSMSDALGRFRLAGFTASEFVDYDAALGGELLLGLRRTADFGPVVTVGTGGVYAEFLGENFKPGRDVAVLSHELTDPESIGGILSESAVLGLVTNPPRGQRPRVALAALTDTVTRLLWLGDTFGDRISEFEINPLVIADGGLVALDVLCTLSGGPVKRNPARPVAKIRNLLEPRSAAVVGVSEKLNPGHVIVNNLLREGFDPSRLYVVKPGSKRLEGCACVDNVASLPERVDLLVVSVAADQVPETVAEVIETRGAEGLIVIPGGFDEKHGGEQLTARMRDAIASARATAWEGPVINGGNCLGIRSWPGRYDTMFIPEHKLSAAGSPARGERPSPVAVISQSGAFGLAAADRLAGIRPKYNITLGNQIDLTVGDYLRYLKDDPEILVYAVYVEGFASLDGVASLRAAREIVATGRSVVLYRAGRTSAGARASSSHTASIAGDYAVARELARHAGVVVARSIADFEDLTRLFALLAGHSVTGRRLGAVSNAGFECVAMADNLGRFTLPEFDDATNAHLRSIFERCRIDRVVDAHNPLDLTPMADDAAYEQAVRAVMNDANVDVGIVGCVPMSPALNTVSRPDRPACDIDREDSVVQRLVRLRAEIAKPWVAVVDAGDCYDPMVARLVAAGIPTFRTADRGVRLLGQWCESRLGANRRA